MLVTIFSFISVDIQILKSVTDYLRIAGLSLILFAVLISFNISLFIIGERWINRRVKFVGLGRYSFLIAFIFVLGIVLVGFGDYKNPADVKNDANFISLQTTVSNDQKTMDELNNKLAVLEEQYKINVNHVANEKASTTPVNYN